MDRGYPTGYPTAPPSSPTRQNKAVLQKEYRDREGGCFIQLRSIIKHLTGEEPRTRQDILNKVIDILSTTYGLKTQEGVPETSAPVNETPAAPYDSASSASYPMDYSTQSPQASQAWHPSADISPAVHYGSAHTYDQYYSEAELAAYFNQANSSRGGLDPPQYHYS